MASKPPGQPVFQLLVRLERVEPGVWRRVLVPGGIPLSKLHDILQVTMGWTNSHLHAFAIDGCRYGMHLDEYPEDEIDERDVTVQQAIAGVSRFEYEYDFGDSWDHEIVVEQFSWHRLGLKFAVCRDGENACPPEDVGGSSGYADFLDAIGDPTHTEHFTYLEWNGGSFDRTAFDVAMINAMLQRVR